MSIYINGVLAGFGGGGGDTSVAQFIDTEYDVGAGDVTIGKCVEFSGDGEVQDHTGSNTDPSPGIAQSSETSGGKVIVRSAGESQVAMIAGSKPVGTIIAPGGSNGSLVEAPAGSSTLGQLTEAYSGTPGLFGALITLHLEISAPA